MHEHVTTICQSLAQAGAIPGKDFSIDATNGLRLNKSGYDLLASLYPDIDWQTITHRIQPDLQVAVEQLHDYLGVDFVPRIVERIHHRLSTLPPTQSAWYLNQVLAGVARRTGITLYHSLLQDVDASRFIYIEQLLADDAEMMSCQLWIGDLVWAAGGCADDFVCDDKGALLTEGGLYLFEQVWAGEGNVYEWEEGK